MRFKYIELGEVAEVMNGYAFKSSEFSEEGIPVVKIKNIVPPNINLEEFRKNNNYSVSDMIEIDIESKFPKYFDFEKTKLYEEIVLNLFYKENSFKYDKCDSFQFILKDKLKY